MSSDPAAAADALVPLRSPRFSTAAPLFPSQTFAPSTTSYRSSKLSAPVVRTSSRLLLAAVSVIAISRFDTIQSKIANLERFGPWPKLLSISMDRCLMPRFLIWQRLQEAGLKPRGKELTVVMAMTMREPQFLRAFVKRHENEDAEFLMDPWFQGGWKSFEEKRLNARHSLINLNELDLVAAAAFHDSLSITTFP